MLTADRLDTTAAELAAAERSLASRVTQIATRSDRLERTATESKSWWSGPRSDAYRAVCAQVARPLGFLPSAVSDALAAIARARVLATELAATLREIERQRDDCAFRLRRQMGEIGWTDHSRIECLRAQMRQLDRRRADVEAHWIAHGRTAADAIAHIAATIPALDPGGHPAGPGSILPVGVSSSAVAGVHPVVDGAAPAEIETWWTDLGPAGRRALVDTIPDVIGNLDGIPLDARATANRTAMQRTLDRAITGSSIWDAMQQFTDRADPARIDPTRRFVVFEPSGDGLVAELFGDITHASSAAVLVPGMGSTLVGFHDLAGRGRRLHAASGPNSAIIAWTGYDTPHAPALSPEAFEVVGDRQAVDGGERLHRFVDGLQTESDAPVTLIGHSYGSLTVGAALRDGARVERVVFMGSPGVGADHVDEFPAGAASEYFASEIKGDLVAQLEHFGSNPTDPDFGARVFDSGDGDGIDPFSRHGEYHDPGIAIENLAAIVTGGRPTPGRTDAVEYLTEAVEDISDTLHAGIDRWQSFDIPLVDDAIPDGALDVVQAGHRTVSQLGEIAIEEVGHFGQDAVEWGVDRVADGLDSAWDRARDLLPGWRP